MKKKLWKIFYSIGCVVGQLVLLVQSMRKAEKHFKEFEILINEIKKAKKLGVK